MIPIFSRIQSQDDTLNRIQQNLLRSLNPVIQLPQTQGMVLPAVSLVSGVNIIEHKLGRVLQGWQLTRMRGVFTQVFDEQNTNLTPSTTLILNASVACVVDIWVW